MESFNIEKPALPIVAPPDAPLDPLDPLNSEVHGQNPETVAASPSRSSTHQEGDVTENEQLESKSGTPWREAEAEDKEGQVWISGIQLFTVMACVTLVCFLMFLDTSIIATAIPQITNDFHSLPDIGWYGSAYQLASAAAQPLTGKIYTHFSSKWSFLAFFLIFELGSLICGVAPSSSVLIVGRAVAGLGSSGMLNGGLTIIAGSVPLPKRPAMIGILMGLSQVGLISGPLIGGALTEYVTWRWCFYINLPIGGLVSVLLIIAKVPDQVAKPSPKSVLPKLPRMLDLVGFVIIAGASAQLLLALQFGGNDFAWNSATVIGLFCGAGATFVVWGFWNYRMGEDALLPFSMIIKRVVWSAMATMSFLFSTIFLSAYFLPIYFQAIKGATPFLSGVYLLPSLVSQLIFAVISGLLAGKLGYYLPWAVGGAILSTISTGLFSTFTPTTTTGEWIGYQTLAGAGRGVSIQMPLVAVQSVLPPSQISIATSLLVFSQYLGSAVFLALANTIFGTGLRSELAARAPDANAEAIIGAGATAFRKFVSPEALPGVLSAYSVAVDRVFYFTAGLGALMFVFSWGMGWKDIREKKKQETAEA